MSHSELERVIEAEGREVLRRLFQGHLILRSMDEASDPVIGAADGRPRTGCRKRTRTLETVFGRVTVERDGYTKSGGDSLFVLDGYLNLPPELYSFGLRRKVAHEAAKVSFDEVAASVERSTGVKVPIPISTATPTHLARANALPSSVAIMLTQQTGLYVLRSEGR